MNKICLALLSFIAIPAYADEPKEIGKFGNWTAYKYTDSAQKTDVCFVANTPTKSEGKYQSRGKITLMVTVRSNMKKKGELSHITGYTYGKNEPVTVKLGKKNFALFTEEDSAWALSDQDDNQLIEAMVNTNEMILIGKSNKGTETLDTYNLKDFSKALKKIRSACGHK
jgi:hypothetical protein